MAFDENLGMQSRHPPAEELPLPQLPANVQVALDWLAHHCNAASVAKGWGTNPDGTPIDEDRCVHRALNLMHSEISEALEEYRKPECTLQGIYFGATAKPEGFPVELADLVHRVFDLCGRYNIPLGRALALKMEYNRTRPHRHGGKRC